MQPVEFSIDCPASLNASASMMLLTALVAPVIVMWYDPVHSLKGSSQARGVGIPVGTCVGLLVGDPVGFLVGVRVGVPLVGLPVGARVGGWVGSGVGAGVGFLVGWGVGLLVGLKVGLAVGILVGWAVGFFVSGVVGSVVGLLVVGLEATPVMLTLLGVVCDTLMFGDTVAAIPSSDGTTVGTLVGVKVGSRVGIGVGMGVPLVCWGCGTNGTSLRVTTGMDKIIDWASSPPPVADDSSWRASSSFSATIMLVFNSTRKSTVDVLFWFPGSVPKGQIHTSNASWRSRSWCQTRCRLALERSGRQSSGR